MEIEVTYNGAPMEDASLVSRCVHRTFAWGRADYLDIAFDDADGEWGSWSPRAGDTVEARCGAARTGRMFVRSVRREGGATALRAYAMPPAMFEPASRSWDAVRLHQLVAQTAAECGMEWAAWRVADRRYGHVDHAGETRMRFLGRRLSLESAALSAFDGRLAAVGLAAAQALDPCGAVAAERGAYRLADGTGGAWGACLLRCGAREGLFRASDGPVLMAEAGCAAADDAEAARWAAGELRRANRDLLTVEIPGMELAPWLAGGCTADVDLEDAPSEGGVMVASSVRHDYVAEETDARFSRPLEGY